MKNPIDILDEKIMKFLIKKGMSKFRAYEVAGWIVGAVVGAAILGCSLVVVYYKG
jgi:hypothetical protein